MYAIVSGRLQLFLDGEDGTEEFLTELRSGDTVGEVVLIDGQPRLATARVQDGVFRVITRRVTLKRESATSSFRTLPDGATCN
jgi:CRP-like cAMP-binding protein